ncbi:class I SAM-dependent methyltransferase [Conexibacter stalactiti]|uniref:Class I SAM-dependent methyltransferase n=1 Tax=Conexibacter stalactiti TaxID=1940611 RepID=A0ABU4HQT8_9ACTN|nr:class I SAM-dependent methyltransferase [Conexibacter stalactiti]MDW5595682.1 class I SAM-dependent methyltransferase [Conexibacter stalactiti]MEC5036324.1 class I SAM-dependent methyltransferase [Conexibacter stalactiti]
MPNELHERNRASWNAATERHLTHRRDLPARLRTGAPILFAEELELLGDLAGRRLAHLQCNDGADTLALARLGARATGVDISDVAIAAARAHSVASGIAASFERADVLDWSAAATARGVSFDVVFASYGALPWIADLDAWMRAAAAVLAPGGRLVVVEFHPQLYVFEEGWRIERSYFGAPGGNVWQEGVEDYVGYTGGGAGEAAAAARGWVNPHPCVEFQWTIGEVIGGALAAGLALERFAEHPHCNGWQPFPDMRGDEQRRFHPPAGREQPLMFSLAARKPG